jgi:hypothetical protein
MFRFSATQMGLQTTKQRDHISPIIKKPSEQLYRGVTRPLQTTKSTEVDFQEQASKLIKYIPIWTRHLG